MVQQFDYCLLKMNLCTCLVNLDPCWDSKQHISRSLLDSLVIFYYMTGFGIHYRSLSSSTSLRTSLTEYIDEPFRHIKQLFTLIWLIKRFRSSKSSIYIDVAVLIPSESVHGVFTRSDDNVSATALPHST